MNRQDAIKTLQKLQADYNDKYIDYEGANEAYKMAIEALQTQLKESPENFNKDFETESMLNADLISRRAVDEYISHLLSDYLYDEERERLEQFSAWLWDELPPVQPAQKVIRCKDCKHFKGKVVCEWHAGFYPDAEYFCADAETKMKEGE